MTAPCEPDPALPADLAALIAELRGARDNPATVLTAPLLDRVRQLAHARLRPDDRLRRVMDSEDLAQDTLMDLINAVDRFRGTSWPEFLAFTRALLERRKVNNARHHAARPGHLDGGGNEDAGDLAANGPTPSVSLAGREETERLRGLIEELPARYRDVLRLRLSGMGYEEIAAREGVTVDNARQRISRALGMLRGRWS